MSKFVIETKEVPKHTDKKSVADDIPCAGAAI